MIYQLYSMNQYDKFHIAFLLYKEQVLEPFLEFQKIINSSYIFDMHKYRQLDISEGLNYT